MSNNKTLMIMETLKMNVYGKEKEIILPVAGMVGTMYVGSDRYTVVCTKVHSNKKCSILYKYDIDERNVDEYVVKGNDGLEYLKEEYFNTIKNEDKEKLEYSLRKNGVWYRVGEPMSPGCCGVTFGHANPYLDPSF